MLNIHSRAALHDGDTCLGEHFWFRPHLSHHLLQVNLVFGDLLLFLLIFGDPEIACHLLCPLEVLCPLSLFQIFSLPSFSNLLVLVVLGFHFKSLSGFSPLFQLLVLPFVQSSDVPGQGSALVVSKLVSAREFIRNNTDDMVFLSSHGKCSVLLIFVQVCQNTIVLEIIGFTQLIAPHSKVLLGSCIIFNH